MALLSNRSIAHVTDHVARGGHLMADMLQLANLRQDSGRRLPTSIVTGLTQHASAALPVRLMITGNTAQRTSATDKRVRAQQRIKTVGDHEPGFLALLNDALLGASDFPILAALLGSAASGGAALIFTVATTTLSVAKVSARVLARDGDEIWRVEEIGKVENRPTYLMAYFLVDPYRGQSASHKGWLLHEARFTLQG
jgi:hypothetical protein